MSHPYEIHVISNTHWDREWLYDFQETRLMLVEFLDQLLDIFEQEPKYKAFLLDSQTVPIEDYLEVRPEARERIKRVVSEGKLWIGPWYTCPEGFIVNGESLVRNLLMGHRIAKQFGQVMKVGHTPFSYGQNSQMPQIYAGFGIDSILFYHGVSHEDVTNEFIFEGADGTQILGSQMSSFARYNYYFHVYRPMVYGTNIDDRVHDWRRGGLPFHQCGEDRFREHHFLLAPQQTYQADKLGDLLNRLKAMETEVATTKYLAFMMGHDSSVGDLIEVRLIEDAQKLLPDDEIFHSTLPDLIAKVKKNVKNLTVLKGERRIPKMMGARLHLYSDVLSSRTRVKRLNARTELALQRRAEPLASLAWLLGAEYPQKALDIAWKHLLQSHAHDSIAGSGVDEIERDVTYRLRQATNLSNAVSRRGLQTLQANINHSDAGTNDILLTVFNPSLFARSEVITAVVDIPETCGLREFSLFDETHSVSIPVQVSTRKPHHAVINHAGDAPVMMKCEQVCFHFFAERIPSCGYATYRLVPKTTHLAGDLVSDSRNMSNEFMDIEIQDNGTLTLFSHHVETTFSGLNQFEDDGEAGHAWMHIEPAIDRVISSTGFPVQISLEERGALLARYRIDYCLEIPRKLDENGGDPWQRLDGAGSSSKRSDETVPLKISSWITLRKGSPALEITTRFENRAENHRLRVLFPTSIDTEVCQVETAFDVVDRETEYDSDSPWYRGVNATFPMHRFVELSDEDGGIAIINDGLREYQIINGTIQSIALTLLRAFQVSLTTVSKRWDPHPEMTLSQCPGEHEFRYWIYPHKGDWVVGNVQQVAEQVSVPLEIFQAGAHGGTLPKSLSFLSLKPANLVMTTLKQSESGNQLVLRFYNPTSESITGTLSTWFVIKAAQLLTLEENLIGDFSLTGKSLTIKVGPKKIITLGLELEVPETI